MEHARLHVLTYAWGALRLSFGSPWSQGRETVLPPVSALISMIETSADAYASSKSVADRCVEADILRIAFVLSEKLGQSVLSTDAEHDTTHFDTCTYLCPNFKWI